MRSIIIGALLAPCRGLLVDPLCAVRSSRHSERAGLLAASSGGIRGGFLRRQWASYEAALERRPIRTQMATAAVLAGVGDVIAQCLEGASAFAPLAPMPLPGSWCNERTSTYLHALTT